MTVNIEKYLLTPGPLTTSKLTKEAMLITIGDPLLGNIYKLHLLKNEVLKTCKKRFLKSLKLKNA